MNVKEIIFDKISQEKVIAKEAKEDSDLYRDLGFDSLSFIRLLFEIEKIFGVTFSIEEMQSCLKVKQLVKVVEEKLNGEKHNSL